METSQKKYKSHVVILENGTPVRALRQGRDPARMGNARLFPVKLKEFQAGVRAWEEAKKGIFNPPEAPDARGVFFALERGHR